MISLEEKALHPKVPSYSESTVSPPIERDGEEEKKDSFGILLFSSSDASESSSARDGSTGLGK